MKEKNYATAVADHDSARIRIANPKFDFLVFIGRFQPPHRAHIYVVEHALKMANYVIVAVGSSYSPRGHRNPFTFDERKEMILGAISQNDRGRVLVVPVEDWLYDDIEWVSNVQSAVMDVVDEYHDFQINPRIGLIGYSKDGSSYYLNLFPQWGSGHVNVEPAGGRVLSATHMRRSYFSPLCEPSVKASGDVLPPNVQDWLLAFAKTPAYRDLLYEYEKIDQYWKDSHVGMFEKYEPTFNTVDCVVIQSGHVLLIRRGEFPYKDCWMFPGGFIQKDEELLDAAIRELREETRIRVPDPVLRGSVRVGPEPFGNPFRDPRGRVFTYAFLLVLTPQSKLPDVRPKVQGADDAAEAKWWPLSEVTREMMAFDGYDILRVIRTKDKRNANT